MRAALLAVALGLAGVSAWQLTSVTPEAGPLPSVDAPAGRPPMVTTAAPRAAWVATALARPLFAPGRRPASEAVAASDGPPTLPRLAGVLVDGSDRRVLLVPAGGSAPVVARVGAQVGGVTIKAIEAGQATVATPDGLRVLRVSFAPRSATIAAAVPPSLPLNLPDQPPVFARAGNLGR